jgi:hypothetical protein
VGEIKVTFAVQPRMLPDDLNTNGPQHAVIGGHDHLKFCQAFLQFIGRQKHGLPERLETFTVVRGRASDAKNRQIHAAKIGPFLPKSQNDSEMTSAICISAELCHFQRTKLI